jgi:glutamate dehydrogenase/leucine dehydrogenase
VAAAGGSGELVQDLRGISRRSRVPLRSVDRRLCGDAVVRAHVPTGPIEPWAATVIESKRVLTFEELLETWEGETAVVRRDQESGAWIFVCLHSTRLGPSGGGTRMKVYGTPAEALEDAMRLSAAMTRKLAVAGLPFGGGKAVIAVPEIPSGEQRRALFLRYADLVASLGGTFRTSSDMNTGEADMDVIGERTEYVFGRSVEAGGSGSPAPPTAVGVYHGIRASLSHVFGSDDLEGRIVVVQGAGGVGSPLADHLANAVPRSSSPTSIPGARTPLPLGSAARRCPPTNSSRPTATSSPPARSAAS